jgi:hypothetical protein
MTKSILINIHLAFVAGFAILLTGPQAQGDVLLSEEFRYSDGQLIGNDGGFSLDANNRWDGAWQNAVWEPPESPASWRISGNQFETNATLGAIRYNQGVERLIQENQATDTYYFGFNIKFWNNTSPESVPGLFGMGIDDGNSGGGGPDLSAVMIVDDFWDNGGSQTIMHGNIITGGVSGATKYPGSSFHRVVGKVDFNATGSSDELTLWVNPAQETDPPEVFHTGQDIGDSLHGKTVSIFGRNVYAHPSWQVDSFNLTTDFDSARVGALNNDPLSYGHTQMVARGMQLEPFTNVGYKETKTFDTSRWDASNFTTIDFLDRVHPNTTDHKPAGLPNSLPWSRMMGLQQVDGNLQPEEIDDPDNRYLPSLVRIYLADEVILTSQENLNTMARQVTNIHNWYPGVMAHTNLASTQIVDPATGAVQPAMLNYLDQVRPDVIVVNNYPYIDPGHPDFDAQGGSPTWMYTVYERVRQLGLGGHDGSGYQPIPTGVISQAFTDGPGSWWDRAPAESEIRQQHFTAWAFGMTTAKPFVYDDFVINASVESVMFDGSGTDSPTATFDHFAETNRQSLNLGDSLVRLISTDARMIMGQHDNGQMVTNTLPTAVTAWDASADPFITSISATNLGSLNNSLAGDVIVGYFEPLDEQFTDPDASDDDDLYFMIVNGLSDPNGLASQTQQEITINFDFASDPSISGLQRLSRDTGLVESVSLTPTGGTTYQLLLTLDGGTGDLFKFNTGSSFVGVTTVALSGDFDGNGIVDAADYTIWQDNLGSDAAVLGGNGSGAATVVQADYAIWKTNFGATAASSSGANLVPEPATLLLALLALAAVPRRVQHS